MSINLTNGFHPPSNSSLSLPEVQCVENSVGRYVLTSISCAYVLLILPLCLFILYLGFQRWRRQRAGSSATAMTHSDFFTYNMCVMELVAVFGYLLFYCSSYFDLPDMSLSGILIGTFTWFGQTLFPILTCVESYLAVVHPITYRRLRQSGGVRVRNACCGGVWLICSLWMCFVILLNYSHYYRRVTAAFMLTLSLIVMAFCSLSAVRVLIRPRLGKVGRGGDRVQADQSKRRAVRSILIIMAVLWVKIGGNVIMTLIKFSPLVSVKCVGEALTYVFFLPCAVALPLLFLHRAGKLPTCKHTVGQDDA